MARVHEAREAREAVCGHMQPENFAAHAAHFKGGGGAGAVGTFAGLRADAAHVDDAVEFLHAAIFKMQRAVGFHAAHGASPVPARGVRGGEGGVHQPLHGGEGVKLAFAGQEPGVCGAVQGGFESLQFVERQGAHAVGGAGGLPFGGGAGGGEPVKDALRGAEVAAVREHEAAEVAEHGARGQGGADVPPEGDGAPAKGGDGGFDGVKFCQRAEHAGGGKRCGGGHVGFWRLAAKDGFGAGSGVKDADLAASARKLPGEQATQRASAGDADGTRGGGGHWAFSFVSACRGM